MQISFKTILELKSQVDPLIGLIVSYMYHNIFNLKICFEYDVTSDIVFFYNRRFTHVIIILSEITFVLCSYISLYVS